MGCREIAIAVVDQIGISKLQIEETHLIRGEERPGMPGPEMELDRDIAGDAECPDAVWRRARLIGIRGGRRRDGNEPVRTPDRGQTLGHPVMTGDVIERHATMVQAHHIEARRTLRKVQLCILRAEWNAILQRRQNLAKGGETRGIKFQGIQ